MGVRSPALAVVVHPAHTRPVAPVLPVPEQEPLPEAQVRLGHLRGVEDPRVVLVPRDEDAALTGSDPRGWQGGEIAGAPVRRCGHGYPTRSERVGPCWKPVTLPTAGPLCGSATGAGRSGPAPPRTASVGRGEVAVQREQEGVRRPVALARSDEQGRQGAELLQPEIEDLAQVGVAAQRVLLVGPPGVCHHVERPPDRVEPEPDLVPVAREPPGELHNCRGRGHIVGARVLVCVR